MRRRTLVILVSLATLLGIVVVAAGGSVVSGVVPAGPDDEDPFFELHAPDGRDEFISFLRGFLLAFAGIPLTSGLHAIERIPGGWRGAADSRREGVARGAARRLRRDRQGPRRGQ